MPVASAFNGPTSYLLQSYLPMAWSLIFQLKLFAVVAYFNSMWVRRRGINENNCRILNGTKLNQSIFERQEMRLRFPVGDAALPTPIHRDLIRERWFVPFPSPTQLMTKWMEKDLGSQTKPLKLVFGLDLPDFLARLAWGVEES